MSQYNLGRSCFLIIIGGGVPGSFQAKFIFPPHPPPPQAPSGTLLSWTDHTPLSVSLRMQPMRVQTKLIE